MLVRLNISNYALIQSVSLDFDKGMTAITGETGSGKSILLGAFGLLMGERADVKTIKEGAEKCIVEATFQVKGYGLRSFFIENDLDYEDQTIVRREVSASGKSRAFINDTPVQLPVLRTLAAALVDVHSQHENSMLGQRKFQFESLDSFSNAEDQLNEYRQLYKRYSDAQKELNELRTNEAKLRMEYDYIKFQLNELHGASLESMHQQSMEQNLETLNNAEHIKLQMQSAITVIDNETSGVIAQLATVKNILQKISHFHSSIAELHSRLDSCYIELRELLREAEALESNVQVNETEAAMLSEKLSVLYALQQKHRVTTVEQLIELRAALEQKIGTFENFDERTLQLEKEIADLQAELNQVAGQISISRKIAAKKLEQNAQEFFKQLHLEHALLKVDLQPGKTFTEYGKDDLQFLFRANKGGRLQPIQHVASGGEISRVVLALKAAISHHKLLPVLILDEIDQGVSGQAATAIGEVLKRMSGKMQLLAITHLPQIAGKATHHMKVYKKVEGETTNTYVARLNDEQRVNELAEMLSGKTLSNAAIANARELMSN